MVDRPSVPHHLQNPRATPRPKTGPLEPVGEGSAPAMPKTPAEWAYLEGMILESLVAQERRLMLRLETSQKAQESAELTMARRSARRSKGLATVLGTAAGVMLVVFSTAWSIYRDTRQVAEQAAVDTTTVLVEAKAVPLETRVDAVEHGLLELDEDVGSVGRKVDDLTSAVSGLLSHIEEREVPQARKRPR